MLHRLNLIKIIQLGSQATYLWVIQLFKFYGAHILRQVSVQPQTLVLALC